MAASVLRFKRIFTRVPGAYSFTDRSSMALNTPQAQGVIAIVGEGEGGGAGNGGAIVEMDNAQDALDTFRGGVLREMPGIAFDPSLDSRVGGARRVLTVKVNPAVQASRLFSNVDGPALLVTSQDYGLFCNQIAVEVATDGALPAATVDFSADFEGETELVDDVGGDAWLSVAYANAAGLGYVTAGLSVGVDGSADPDKVVVDCSKSAMTGGASAVGFAAGDRITIPNNNISNNGKVVTVYGVNSDGEPDSEALTLAGTGAHAPGITNKSWQYVTGAKISAAVTDADVLIQDEAASTDLTVATGDESVGLFSETNTTANLASIIVADRPVSMASSGASTEEIVLRGLDPSGTAQTEVVTLTGAVAVAGSKSWAQITQIETGRLLAAQALTLGPAGALVRAVAARATASTANTTRAGLTGTYTAAWASGDAAIITSGGGAADAGRVVTLYGETTGAEYQTEDVTLGATGVGTGVTEWGKVYYAAVDDYCTGPVTVADQTPTTTQTIPQSRLTSGLLAGPTAGYHDLDLPVANTTVDVVASGATVRTVMLVGLDTASAVQREIVTLTGAVAVTSTLSWSRLDGVYVGDLEAARTVSVTAAYRLEGGATTIQQVADWITARTGFTGTVVTTAPTTDLVTELDVPTVATYGAAAPLSVLNLTKALYAKLTELIREITASSSYVTATRQTGATGVPTDTVAPVFLASGSEGVSTYANWLAALVKLKTTEEPSTIIVCTENAAVQAALAAHLRERESTLRREANGKVGLTVDRTKTLIGSDIVALNYYQIQAFGQEIQRYNTNGVLTWYPPFAAGVLYAGMQAGAAPGVPMTHKYANVVDVRQSSTWDPTIDADDMIKLGLCILEPKTGQGFRWVRGITTYRGLSDLSQDEDSTNFAVNEFIKGFRAKLEALTGDVNFAGDENSAKALAIGALDESVESGEIMTYRGLVVTTAGDKLPVYVEVVPPIPRNFIPITAHLSVS